MAHFNVRLVQYDMEFESYTEYVTTGGNEFNERQDIAQYDLEWLGKEVDSFVF